MSQVLPTDLAVRSTNAAYARASFWFGIVFLSATFACLLFIVPVVGRPSALPVFPALALMALGGVMLVRLRTDVSWIIGAAALLVTSSFAWYTYTVLIHQEASSGTDNPLLSLPVVAMTMFGVTAARYVPGFWSAVVTFAVAEAIVVTAAIALGHRIVLDVAATTIFVVIALMLGLLDTSRRSARSITPELQRANAADAAAQVHERVQSRTAALVHATILNELAVVSTLPPGPLPERVRNQLLAGIAGLRDIQHEPERSASAAGALDAAVAEARESGLRVTVEGPLASAALLPPPTERALALAVRQCLANVLAHAGTGAAEVALIAAESTVTVMVIDSGRGFVEAAVASDRLGLRSSVRTRIREVGGTVDLWTTPGVGTSVSITVPLT
ncbi:MAG: sensor histidine kinase [Microbacteriaceae bacterium]